MEHPATAAKFQKRGRYNFSVVTLAGGHVQPHELGHLTSGSRRPAGPVSVAMRPFQAVSATAALATRVGSAGPARGAGWDAPHRARPASRPLGPRGSREVRPRLSGRAFKSVVPTGGEGAGSASPHAGREEGKRGPWLAHSLDPPGRRRQRSGRGRGAEGVGARAGGRGAGGRGARATSLPSAPAPGSPALGVRRRRCLRPDSRGGWKGQGRHDLA